MKKFSKNIIFISLVSLLIVLITSIYSQTQAMTEREAFEIGYKAGFASSYIHVNTTNLKTFCSDSQYVPTKYINLFQSRFIKTEEYSKSNFIKLNLTTEQFNALMQKEKNDNLKVLNNEFQKIQNINPTFTKRQFCQMYDNNKENIVNDRIRRFKTVAPDLYKD